MDSLSTKKKKMKKLTLFILALIWIQMGFSQDRHFTNEGVIPFSLNPASTGQFEEDFRVALQYRNQWSSISKGYNTYALGFDHHLQNFAWGLTTNQNKAGQSGFSKTSIALSGAYHQALGAGSRLSFGANVGFMNYRIDPTKLQFGSQYHAELGFDPNIGSGEDFINTKLNLPDLGVGLQLELPMGKNGSSFTSGFSLAHLIAAKDNLLEGEMSSLPMRLAIQSSMKLAVNSKIQVEPMLQLKTQTNFKEWLANINVHYQVNENAVLTAGGGYRLKDAFFLNTALDFNKVKLSLSYEVNTSSFRKATNGMGAIELGLSYRFKAKSNQLFNPKQNIIELPQVQPANKSEILDTDYDGIPDQTDRCPYVAGSPKFNGCRDLDEDGIPDIDDACPRLKGQFSEKGCPLTNQDSDKDGIPDIEDRCVWMKGTASFEGCPDTDNDGIADPDDFCPYLKGTNPKGCPLSQIDITEPKTISRNMEPITQNKRLTVIVEFDTDQTNIKSQYVNPLNEAVDFIRNCSTCQVILEGHTDSEGNVDYNYDLGYRRAKAVEAYLNNAGVSPYKMQKISYGENRPAADNFNLYGKAKNRRVLVVIVQ